MKWSYLSFHQTSYVSYGSITYQDRQSSALSDFMDLVVFIKYAKGGQLEHFTACVGEVRDLKSCRWKGGCGVSRNIISIFVSLIFRKFCFNCAYCFLSIKKTLWKLLFLTIKKLRFWIIPFCINFLSKNVKKNTKLSCGIQGVVNALGDCHQI